MSQVGEGGGAESRGTSGPGQEQPLAGHSGILALSDPDPVPDGPAGDSPPSSGAQKSSPHKSHWPLAKS
jgi:hypothetical protein